MQWNTLSLSSPTGRHSPVASFECASCGSVDNERNVRNSSEGKEKMLNMVVMSFLQMTQELEFDSNSASGARQKKKTATMTFRAPLECSFFEF